MPGRSPSAEVGPHDSRSQASLSSCPRSVRTFRGLRYFVNHNQSDGRRGDCRGRLVLSPVPDRPCLGRGEVRGLPQEVEAWQAGARLRRHWMEGRGKGGALEARSDLRKVCWLDVAVYTNNYVEVRLARRGDNVRLRAALICIPPRGRWRR